MTDAERREATRQFINKWNGKGNEDQESQLYWIDFLTSVVGMENVTDRVSFEKKVIVDGHSKKIDAYIPETHTLIEQKSVGKALDKKTINSGDVDLTPYEQAKRYNDNLPYDEKARWIITSNFAEIWIYDMNMPVPEPVKVNLSELQTKYAVFDFMANKEQKKISQEMEISVKAGEFVGLIYDALLRQYINPDSEESLKSLNMLCVRLVFCLYAEDAHIFGESGHMFHDYMEQFETKDMRKALIELFKTLDTPEEKRDKYDTSGLLKFPYVNGGLFAEENIEIPNFTDEIRDILLEKASEGFDWSMISPTIFGAVFESTLNPETRRSGGMHYTSIENIHKVIDPLFLDALKDELQEIKTVQVEKTRNDKLKTFQNKLSQLTWLDPACGSGNFLTETYISIRRLENDVINTLKGGQISFTDEEHSPIKVGIDQFYGIEINDFAVTVAKTALWIAESQMLKETEDILLVHIDFLPLKTNAHIIEGNALRIDWNEICSKEELSYIMGNPPFVGAQYMTKDQKNEIFSVFPDNKRSGVLDYVACWYEIASRYILDTKIECAFVSTNSICQGEQVATLWRDIFKRGIYINFAYRTFNWASESNVTAGVHCIILGFSTCERSNKFIVEGESIISAKNINAYLLDGINTFIDSRSKPICNVPEITKGCQPTDGGNLIIEADEYEDFIQKEPNAKKYIKKLVGAKEFTAGTYRYCLWLVNASPKEIKEMPLVMDRIQKVREMRLNSPDKGTQKLAETPTVFRETYNPESFIVVPSATTKRRRYIPLGFMHGDVISTNLNLIIPDATLYHFGVLTSNIHMAWTRVVCGRLRDHYRYSKNIVYNNYPWPTATDEQKQRIEQTAQAILDIREHYSDSSLADLYDPLTMPVDLQKAHTANDKAVMQAYGFNVKDMSEEDCVAELMKLYQQKITELES